MSKPVESFTGGVTYRRVSARDRWCDTGDHPAIKRGAVYLRHVAFPGHDAGYATKFPVHSAECATCAERYGRGGLL